MIYSQLTDYAVGEELVSLLDNQETEYPHSKIAFSMIEWSELGVPDQHKFISISKTILFGNCAKCFRPWPLGLMCSYCRGPEYTRSIMLYFVHSESAASVVISLAAALSMGTWFLPETSENCTTPGPLAKVRTQNSNFQSCEGAIYLDYANFSRKTDVI